MSAAKQWVIRPPWLDEDAATPVPKQEWGPPRWYWLHTQAINYPVSPTDEDKATMFALFWAFVRTLPCEECRGHATGYARAYPPDFSGSEGLQTWAWRFHNAANKRLGKEVMPAAEYTKKYSEELAERYWQCVEV